MELVASTYVGGGRGDYLDDIALDRAGDVYVAGSTNSSDFPVANPLQSTWTEGPLFHDAGRAIFARDFVVAKLDATLSTLEFSTYFGGSGHDGGASLAVDSSGTIHVAGSSSGRVLNIDRQIISTADFPVLNAQQPEFGGGDFGHFLDTPNLETDAVFFALVQRGTLAGRGFSTTQGREFNNIVAGFTSQRHDASPGDFTATIDWGDGTHSTGNVRRRDSVGSVFLVEGLHAYDTPGAYPVVVHVEDHKQAILSPITNIDISHFEQSQTSGSIAVDLTHPNQLFAAMTDEQGEARAATGTDGGIVVATSTDAGATWAPRLVGSAADKELPSAKRSPDVLFDKFGNLFLAYEGAEGNNIVVAWSTDGGKTFDANNVRELVPAGSVGGAGTSVVGSPKLAFSDMNSEIWVTFEDVINDRILVAAAGVGGLDDVGAFNLRPINGSAGGFFSDIAVGPDGSVAVAWQTAPASGAAKILASVDPDGTGPGVFSAPTVVTTSSTNGALVVACTTGAYTLGGDVGLGQQRWPAQPDVCMPPSWTWPRTWRKAPTRQRSL